MRTGQASAEQFHRDKGVRALVQMISHLGLCSVTSLRRMCRRYLSSSIGTQRLVAEGKTRPPAPKPDANSSDELIRGHFDKLGFGIQPVETTIRWDRIECLHQSRCENCQQLRTCPYQRWFMTGRHGYQPIRDPRLQLIRRVNLFTRRQTTTAVTFALIWFVRVMIQAVSPLTMS